MVWPAEQTGAFLDAVADDRLYALWHLITFRCLRRGEACGLRWADTDLDRGVISIQAQLVQIGWTVRESTPKSEASDAKVALDATTVAVLKSWRKAQVAERLAWGEAWTDSARVFTREDGRPPHPSFVTVRFQRLAFDAGLPPIREHDLRHGAASLARKGGVDMKGIQAMLRHSSQAITADTYTSTFDEESRKAAEAVASAVPRKVAVGEASETDVPWLVPRKQSEGPPLDNVIKDHAGQAWLVGRPGLEPGTYGLKVRYSAIELTPRGPPWPAVHGMKRTESGGWRARGDPAPGRYDPLRGNRLL
jgi:Phage integrase family